MTLVGVGQQFPNADESSRQDELQRCKPGERVNLRLEPENPKDPNAIAINSQREVQIGYLRRSNAHWLSEQFRAGAAVTAIIKSVEPRGRPFGPLCVTLSISLHLKPING